MSPQGRGSDGSAYGRAGGRRRGLAGRPLAGDGSRAVRRACAAALVTTVPVVALCAVVRGGSGALGAAIGSLLAVGFFAVTLAALLAVTRAGRPEFLPGAMLASYVCKIVAVAAVLVGVRGTSGVDRPSLAVAMGVGIVVFLAVEVTVATRSAQLYVEPGAGAPPPGR